MCSRIPRGLDPRWDNEACPIVFDGTVPSPTRVTPITSTTNQPTLGPGSGSSQTGTFRTETLPTGSLPTGTLPQGSLPTETLPQGSLPTGTRTAVITTALSTSSSLPTVSQPAPSLPFPTALPELEDGDKDELDDGREDDGKEKDDGRDKDRKDNGKGKDDERGKDDAASSADGLDELDLLARAEFLASDSSSDDSSSEDTCISTLQLPTTLLNNTRKEDLVFLAFQVWTLSMSLAALLNESIPSIIGAFVTHGLNTAWGAFQVAHTNGFRADYEKIVENGACQRSTIPTLLSPKSYWTPRRSFELPSLVIHILSLFVSAFLTWRLVKLFGWNTFSRLGASRTRDRAFKVSLSLSSSIHLGIFFLGVQACLWIDELRSGVITTSSKGQFPMGAAVLPLLLILPWVLTGSYAIKAKSQKALVGFAFLTASYTLTTLFFSVSPVYRWTVGRWRFFGIVSALSGLLLLGTFGLTVACLVYWRKEERVGGGGNRGDQESQRSGGSSMDPHSWMTFTSISTQSFASFATPVSDQVSEKGSNPFSDPGDRDSDEFEQERVSLPVPNPNPKFLSVGTLGPSVDYGALHIKYPLENISPSSTIFPMRG